jgi:hypothetical protein
MLLMMKQTIEVLKSKVTLNLEEIKRNEAKFKQLLNDGKALECAEELSALLEHNKNLLSENFDFINVQLSILKFLGRAQSQDNNDVQQLSQQEIQEIQNSMDIFRYTLNGKLPYNVSHPLLFDENFCARLMKFYSETFNRTKVQETLNTWSLGHLN